MGPWRRVFTLVMLLTAAAAPVSPQAPYPVPSPFPAPAAQAAPLTLDQAFALAAANNRTITAARLRRAVDQAGINVARERPNPDLRYEQSKETPHESLTAAQLVELGGKRGRRITVARAVARIGGAELARTLADVRAQVRRSYYGLASAQARVTIALDLQALAGRARDAAQARF